MEKSITETIMVHWNTESPKKYVASVDKVYSETIPDKPVANNATLSKVLVYFKSLQSPANQY